MGQDATPNTPANLFALIYRSVFLIGISFILASIALTGEYRLSFMVGIILSIGYTLTAYRLIRKYDNDKVRQDRLMNILMAASIVIFFICFAIYAYTNNIRFRLISYM